MEKYFSASLFSVGIKRSFQNSAGTGAVVAGFNPESLKRLSIAVETVAQPHMLFLDELASGLVCIH